jgi:hypothetical protein
MLADQISREHNGGAPLGVKRAQAESTDETTGLAEVKGREGTKKQEASESVARAIYEGDPLVRLLAGRLRLRGRTMALIGLGWGLVYSFVLPALFGSLVSRDGYLGSLDDWHARILLLLVFPATCAFYMWQPTAIAGVYQAMGLQGRSAEAGKAYRSRLWLGLSIAAAVAIVLFDTPKMIAHYGSWWMVDNWLSIWGREASLAAAFYILSMLAWRQVVSTVQWKRAFASPSPVVGLRAASDYQLSLALLLALLGLRLSVEGIELPQRAGAITPDYYAKVAVYTIASLLCFFTPTWGAFRREGVPRVDQLVVWLELVGIIALPLLGFIILRLALGP